ncbi:hypothetical protein [Nocardiopsis valliformis]|uniref:hypothetical protein n=1 Tax=Nocardiopsis valliformis TaxID=239974 RepID=UPI00036FE023|nr:hypothetical protein [Nocardiopsis valliformis]
MFGVYFGRLWALVLVAGLPVVPLVLLAQVHVVWPARQGAFVNGVLESTVDPLGTSALALMGGLTVLGLLITPLTLGGSMLIGGGALLGRRLSVRDAWRGALRHYFTVLALALMLLLLVGAAVAVALWLLMRGWPLPGIAIVVLPPLMFPLTLLMVALPAALLEGHGPFRGLAAAWRIGRYRRGTHLLFVSAGYGVSVLFGTVLERSLLRWSGLAEGDLALVGITAAASVLVAPLSLLLLCAPVVYSGGNINWLDSTVDLDLARADQHLPAPSEAPRVRVLRLTAVPVLIVVLFTPPLLGPAAVAANPFQLPELTVSPIETVGSDSLVMDITATDDGALIAAARRNVRLTSCDPDCVSEFEGYSAERGSGVSVQDGQLLRTHWRDPDGYWDYDTLPGAGLYLAVCEDALDCDEEDYGALLRPFDGGLYDIHSTVAPLADGGLIVASHVRHDPEVARDSGGLLLQVCSDTTCESPRPLELPAELTVGGFLVDGAYLDLAAAPGGGFGLAAVDPSFGTLSLVTCADSDCAEPEVTEVFGDQFRIENERRLRQKFSARIEYRSDGTPVTTYRDLHTGEARLVDCHDAVCSEFTDTAVTGPGWARPTPGLAIDSQDRPQLLTPDMAAEELVLLSCLDPSCTNTESTPLIGFEQEPGITALTLDAHDRPHMVWGEGGVGVSGDELRLDSQYLSCANPYCGTELTTP